MAPKPPPVIPEDTSFEEIYRGGSPPWDIGRPQPAIVKLQEQGKIKGSVLDAGCGTGEHALLLASKGHEAWGIDGAPTAIARAKAKAKERKIEANFVNGDALALEKLGRTFDTVIDSGLFHVFDDDERPKYVASLHRALKPGGSYFMICFSEHEPGGWGPRRVTQGEIRAAFKKGWKVESIEATRFAANAPAPEGARAWLSHVRRT